MRPSKTLDTLMGVEVGEIQNWEKYHFEDKV